MDAVYDITVAYPEDIIQAEKDLILRGPPRAIYFLVKRHAASELPQTAAELETWLGNCWQEKERTLARFYEKKTFSTEVHGRRLNAIPLLYVSCFVWTGLVAFWLWLLSTFLIADLYFIVALVVYTVITFYLNGIDRFELARFKLETQTSGWLTAWLINVLFDWLIDWLIDWLVDGLTYWSMGWLIDWFDRWILPKRG